MKNSSLGLLAGLLLAIAIAVDGFSGFFLAVVLGVVGYLAGRHLDGDIDLTELLRGRRE